MKVLVTGSTGFVGSNLMANTFPECELVRLPSSVRLNEIPSPDAGVYFRDVCTVIHLAADAGGIHYNIDNSSRLLKSNLQIGMNVIDLCVKYGVKNLINAGTICSYPEIPETMPMIESEIWNGYPEKSNAPYGNAKRLVMEYGNTFKNKLNMINLMFTNLYGKHDCFKDNRSHVIPALMNKFRQAKINDDNKCVVWGTGNATRDFLYVDDAVKIIGLLLQKLVSGNIIIYDIINIGTGKETGIKELAGMIAGIFDYHGEIIFDSFAPDGQPRRVLNIDRLKKELDYAPETDLKSGLENLYKWKYADETIVSSM